MHSATLVRVHSAAPPRRDRSVAELRATFSLFDHDSDSFVQREDLKKAWLALGATEVEADQVSQ